MPGNNLDFATNP